MTEIPVNPPTGEPPETWLRSEITVFEVLQNSDMTEGRGRTTVLARVRDRVSAERIAPGMGVHGSNADVRQVRIQVFSSNRGEILSFDQRPLNVYDDAKAWAKDYAPLGDHRAREILADEDPLYRQYLELKEKFGE